MRPETKEAIRFYLERQQHWVEVAASAREVAEICRARDEKAGKAMNEAQSAESAMLAAIRKDGTL